MDKVKIKALLKAHCTIDGNRWVFKQVDINEASIELEQTFCKPDVSGWQEFEKRMPNEGDEVVIANSYTGQKVIMYWYRIYEPVLDKNCDRWMLLPAIS